MMRIRLLAVSFALALTATIAGSVPAEAAWEGVQKAKASHSIFDPGLHKEPCITSVDGWIKACFRLNGDQLRVYDWFQDGMRTGMQWRTSYGRSGVCWWYGKKGALDGFVDGMCNKNFREHTTIRWRVGRCDGTVHPCGRPVNKGSGWRDWSAWKSSTTGT